MGPPGLGYPQHWKWFIAYTDSGRIVNGWIWIARGEWGFAGYVVRDGVTVPVARIEHHADYHADMTQRRLEADLIDITGQPTHLSLDVFGVIKLPPRSHEHRDLRRGLHAEIDGEAARASSNTAGPPAAPGRNRPTRRGLNG